MNLSIYIIDAFASKQFEGNPAAVMLLDNWLPDALLQSIAAENNLSETAFIMQRDEAYHIRWFSPLTEIQFCGHATLASAFVLFTMHPERQCLSFYAKSVGTMEITRTNDNSIEMAFPNRKPTKVDTIPEALLQGLSLRPQSVLKNQQAFVAVYAQESDVYTVEYDSEQLKKLAPLDVVVTAQGKDYDFVSRYFWPANGGDEDPVTGSIHAALAPYWAEKLAKTTLHAYQASSRGGVLHCRVDGDTVYVSGQAVQYLQGTVTLHEVAE